MNHENPCDGCQDAEPCEDCKEAARLRAEYKAVSIAYRTPLSYPPRREGMNTLEARRF